VAQLPLPETNTPSVKPANHLRDWLFRQIHANHLVYNTCWEDPRCDRELLQLDDDSRVVMITSAGCNALDYLLDGPAAIHCIDMNPRQNTLLELKIAGLRCLPYEDFFQLFGAGAYPEAVSLYHDCLREQLPVYARQFWDKNIAMFTGRGLRRTFYHYSTSGTFAWLANQYLGTRRDVYEQVLQLFEAGSLEEQAAIYYRIEPRILNSVIEWFVNRHLTMCLVGVPRSQQLLFRHRYERGTLGFIQECLRKVFTERPVHDNYFWRVYLRGAYTRECCPAYLKEGNFRPIADRLPAIELHTMTITDFLTRRPGVYSHFVLLDHQDWLAANDRPALEEEWRLILANSRPGTRILLRSAAPQVDFFPGFVRDAIVFEREQTARTHQKDRVGTYASVYLGIVQ